MKRPSKARPILASLLLLILSGCASLSDPGITPLARKLPDDCERIATAIQAPKLATGDDAKVQVAKHRAALAAANKALDKSRECMAIVRTQYGG